MSSEHSSGDGPVRAESDGVLTSAEPPPPIEQPALYDDGERTVADLEPSVSTGGHSADERTQIDVLPATPRTPAEAMRHASRMRTLTASPALVVTMAVVAAILPFFGGNPTAKLATYVALSVCAASCAVLWWLSAEPARFRIKRVWVFWYIASSAAGVIPVFFGIFSPGVIAMVMAIYFIGLNPLRYLSEAVYATAAALHGVSVVLYVSGTVADPGLIAATDMTRREQILGALLVQALLGLTYLFSRSTRAAMFEAVSALHAAALVAAQREVVVGEAVDELQRAAALLPGRLSGTQLGEFALGEVIGRGGMGEIYRAVHRETGDLAAVKVLHPMFGDEPLALERFTREARHAGSLDTPHVVRVIETGDGTEPFMAMELLAGEDLGAVLRRRRTLTPGETRRLVRHIGRGLDLAAAQDIVHRDIKPQNLFRAEVGADRHVWKILDFGIARLSAHGDTLTQNTIMGTPSYIAPEQARGKTPTPRADLYGLAACAYRALTGFPPHQGKDANRIVMAVVHAMPRRPTMLADLPVDADAFFAVALARDPDQRFANGRELSDAFDAALESKLNQTYRRRAAAILEHRPWSEE
jgi:serine/threonine-protein kinase